MKTTLLNVVTIGLAWAVAVFAHPSHIESAYGVTPRDQDPNDAGALLGINCRGSALCSLPSCTVSIATIKKYADTLDDKEEWGNGNQIACNLCPGCAPGGPNCAGICAFPQNLKKDEKVNGRLIKNKINDLLNHKCGRCGSCPTKEGNDVSTGEITVNYVTSGCREGVCDYKRHAAREENVPSVTVDQFSAEDFPFDQTIDVYGPIDTSLAPGTSDNVQTLGTGINCKGSSMCKYCRGSLEQILRTVDTMPQDLEFTNDQHIVCQQCDHKYIAANCVFSRNLHRPIAVRDVKVLLKRLFNNKCGRCGSVPLREGGDIAQGMLTANYVHDGCPKHGTGWGCGPP